MFAFGVVRHEPLTALLGPALATLCLVPLLATRLSQRLAISLPTLALLSYAVLAFSVLPSVFDDSDIPVFFVQGLVLVLSGVVLVVANDDRFRWLSKRLADAGGGLATRLGLVNPLAKRFRTGVAARDVRAHRVRPRLHGSVRRGFPSAGAAHHRGHERGLRLAGRQQPRQSRHRRTTPVGTRRRAGDPVGPIAG